MQENILHAFLYWNNFNYTAFLWERSVKNFSNRDYVTGKLKYNEYE